MAKKVDISLIAQLNAGAEGQEIKKGYSKSTDSRFPVFSTPVNEDILVYIPKTNVVATENGEEMKLLNVFLHDYKQGNGYGQLRCVSGLSSGVFEQLGYDGSCPACEATKEVWELYNRKLRVEATKLGVDPQNDPNNVLQAAKQRILAERDLKNAEEYVTFPIVIIPLKGKMQPADDALTTLKVEFVTWRKKRYEDNILSALDTLMENPGHPGGMFWMWKFTYNTDGKQANARDSAKNAKYNLITDGGALAKFSALIPACEVAAKEFTNDKATEVIVANQFMYKDDYDDKVTKIMVKTRSLLEMSNVEETVPSVNANPLASFGGGAIGTEAPQNLGIGTNPIKFGE